MKDSFEKLGYNPWNWHIHKGIAPCNECKRRNTCQGPMASPCFDEKTVVRYRQFTPKRKKKIVFGKGR